MIELQPADVNGDGLPDLIGLGYFQDAPPRSTPRYQSVTVLGHLR